jgi:hypothetical protein
MIFLIWYRAKVLEVLKREFGYELPRDKTSAGLFNHVSRRVRALGGNAYDGAIAFILVCTRALPNDQVLWNARVRTALFLRQTELGSNKLHELADEIAKT